MTITIGLLETEPQLPGEIWRNCAELAKLSAGVGRRPALDDEIVFISARAEGLPTGSAHAVCAAWQELTDAGVLAIIGPATADNCIAVTERADAQCVPTVTISASSYAASAWAFNVSWGSGPEDAFRMADWLYALGLRRVGVVYDTMYHSAEFVDFLRLAAERLDLRILGEERISMRTSNSSTPSESQLTQANAALQNLRELNPDALAVLTTLSTAAVARARANLDWTVPVVCNITSGLGLNPKIAPLMRGWAGVSIFDESNDVARAFLNAYTARHGVPAHTAFALAAYDAARTLLEGIALAPILSRKGVHQGLERVKRLPSSMGANSTYISFGPWDHRGVKGRDSLCLRELDGAGDWRILGVSHAAQLWEDLP